MVIIDAAAPQGEEMPRHDEVLYVGLCIAGITQAIVIGIDLVCIGHVRAIVHVIRCHVAVAVVITIASPTSASITGDMQVLNQIVRPAVHSER